MNIQRLISQLRIYEGEKLKPYVDTVGKITIGNGRNLTDKGIRDDERALMLSNDVNDAITLARQFSWFALLDDVRQEIIVNMCFNMGTRILSFQKMLSAMSIHDYNNAAEEMKDSKWFVQVGERGQRLYDAMKKGSF